MRRGTIYENVFVHNHISRETMYKYVFYTLVEEQCIKMCLYITTLVEKKCINMVLYMTTLLDKNV